MIRSLYNNSQLSQMAETKFLSNPPQSRSRQNGLVEGEWTVMAWSDQLPSVCFRHTTGSKQLGLTGCTIGCFVRNSTEWRNQTNILLKGKLCLEAGSRYLADVKQCICVSSSIVSLLAEICLHQQQSPILFSYNSIKLKVNFILALAHRCCFFIYMYLMQPTLRDVPQHNLETLSPEPG